jgi:CubicO group peptidase (beta-lactamase class C family)
MVSSGYVWIDAYQDLMARPHDEKGKPFNRRATVTDAARYGAAGGLHSTPTDYARFLIEVIDPKPGDGFRLNRSSLDEMLRPQVKVSESSSWGLGWGIQHNGDVITHGGNNPGFQALIAASRKRKSGFVIMTNSNNGFKLFRKLVPSEAMQRFLPVTI